MINYKKNYFDYEIYVINDSAYLIKYQRFTGEFVQFHSEKNTTIKKNNIGLISNIVIE